MEKVIIQVIRGLNIYIRSWWIKHETFDCGIESRGQTWCSLKIFRWKEKLGENYDDTEN